MIKKTALVLTLATTLTIFAAESSYTFDEGDDTTSTQRSTQDPQKNQVAFQELINATESIALASASNENMGNLGHLQSMQDQQDRLTQRTIAATQSIDNFLESLDDLITEKTQKQENELAEIQQSVVTYLNSKNKQEAINAINALPEIYKNPIKDFLNL